MGPAAAPAADLHRGQRAGRHGDGWLTSSGDVLHKPALKAAFRRGARDAGRDSDALPVLTETFVVVGDRAATEQAARLWRFTADPWTPELLHDPDPASIGKKAATRLPLPQVYSGWLRGLDPQVHVEGLRTLLDAGATPFVHSGQPDQQRVLDRSARQVLRR